MEIEALRQANAASEREFETAAAVSDGAALSMEDLNETERSAADRRLARRLKPIPWMNAAHYHTLLTSNALGGRLAQRSKPTRPSRSPRPRARPRAALQKQSR